MGLIERLFGPDLAQKRQDELIAQLLRVAQLQAEANARIATAVEGMYKAYETDGAPPLGRHLSEDQEAELVKRGQLQFGIDFLGED